jgi:hypothetical protein
MPFITVGEQARKEPFPGYTGRFLHTETHLLQFEMRSLSKTTSCMGTKSCWHHGGTGGVR